MTRASAARKKRRHPTVVSLESRRKSPSIGGMRPLVGYYTRADQKPEEPDVDPPHDGPCPVCGEKLTLEQTRVVSVMWSEKVAGMGRRLMLFYRLHRACEEGLPQEAKAALDYTVLKIGDEIAQELVR